MEKEIYAAPVAEMVGVACEGGIALSYGAEGAAGVTSGWMIRIWNGKAYETWLCDGGMPSGCAGRYCGSGGMCRNRGRK